MDELLTELKHLGLSDKEAAVYLASLELGPAAVQDISHKSKVNRATTYVMIESLTARGLMSTFVKGKKRFFVPETPERLMSIIRVQQKELEEKQNELAKTLPLLLAMYNAEGAKPQIRYLEGREGLNTARAVFEKLDGEFLQIVPIDSAMSATDLKEGHQEHKARLAEMNTPHRVLAVADDVERQKGSNMGAGEHRYVSSKDFPMQGEVTVRANHVFLFSYRSSILSVVIVSTEIADAVRALFNLAWKGAQDAPSRHHGEQPSQQ